MLKHLRRLDGAEDARNFIRRIPRLRRRRMEPRKPRFHFQQNHLILPDISIGGR